MEPDPSETKAVRKIKYAPKAQPRRAPKPEVKAEVVENKVADASQAMELLQRFNANQAMKAKAKAERKVAPSQIAFGYGAAPTSTKLYGIPKRGSGPGGLREEKEYKEPWDYYSYYPVTLPLRRPYSGNPEQLDEEEFGEEAAETTDYDENSTKPAVELGLMEESPEPSMFFLQLPPSLPMKKRSETADGQTGGAKQRGGGGRAVEKTCNLDELPAGLMGKMLIYRSGAVKLKLGDTLYDVTSGMDCMFAQDVVAINTEEKKCCVVGELNKRAILTPDVDSVLSSLADL